MIYSNKQSLLKDGKLGDFAPTGDNRVWLLTRCQFTGTKTAVVLNPALRPYEWAKYLEQAANQPKRAPVKRTAKKRVVMLNRNGMTDIDIIWAMQQGVHKISDLDMLIYEDVQMTQNDTSWYGQ